MIGAMQEASAMYLEAVEVMEDEGQETMALDTFRQAIGQLTAPLDCPLFKGCRCSQIGCWFSRKFIVPVLGPAWNFAVVHLLPCICYHPSLPLCLSLAGDVP